MTDIEKKALALVRKEDGHGYLNYDAALAALCRAIEQHEAFKQKVSDAAEVYEEMGCPVAWEGFEQFIIPKPKPDPLVDALTKAGWGLPKENAEEIRAALDALGFEIREKGQ